MVESVVNYVGHRRGSGSFSINTIPRRERRPATPGETAAASPSTTAAASTPPLRSTGKASCSSATGPRSRTSTTSRRCVTATTRDGGARAGHHRRFEHSGAETRGAAMLPYERHHARGVFRNSRWTMARRRGGGGERDAVAGAFAEARKNLGVESTSTGVSPGTVQTSGDENPAADGDNEPTEGGVKNRPCNGEAGREDGWVVRPVGSTVARRSRP